MPRPTTKEELLSLSQENSERLFALVEPLPSDRRSQPGVNGDWAVKDVLAHLCAWHDLFFAWHDEGSQGHKPEMPTPGFTWKTTPELNEMIFQEHRHQPYESVAANLQASHQKMMDIIANHSDEELFTKKKYRWTGSTSLGSYATSCMSSHYQWAFDLIRKWLRSLPEA
jgi:hypothetical protein